MGYGYTSDTQERKDFIDKSKILQYVTEEEIFSLVCGYLPREFEYVTSPFREDKTPRCWFERRGSTLRFIDFGTQKKFFPDCFDAVKIYYKLPNFYRTLEFIYDKLIAGKQLNKIDSHPEHQERERVAIKIEARNFTKEDGEFWAPYGVTRENLIEDQVFPVSRYVMTNTKSGLVDIRVNQVCYGYTEFEEGRKKLYFPNAVDKAKRFITNCNKNDIGGLSKLPMYGEQLILTKSYKDCRVIRNFKRVSAWFQNEGMTPDDEPLHNLVKRFTRVIVLFDNDQTGKREAVSVADKINSRFPNKARPLWLPEHYREQDITDPADLRKAHGPAKVEEFFKSYLI